MPFERGPEELKDLPGLFRQRGGAPSTSPGTTCASSPRSSTRRRSDVGAILAHASSLAGRGADVIDLGCLPDTPFPHLEEAVQALTAAGFTISIDSADTDELTRGIRAGARYVLSLTEHTLDLAADNGVTPVLVPARHGDLDSLMRAAEAAARRNIAAVLDPCPRSHPFRLHGLAPALCRAPATLAGGGNPHGHRQSHRTDRRRLRRHDGSADGHLPRNSQSATSWWCR